MGEKHVVLRCIECKSKFDSKYDSVPRADSMKVGEIYQNFIFCRKCGKRVSVQVTKVI